MITESKPQRKDFDKVLRRLREILAVANEDMARNGVPPMNEDQMAVFIDTLVRYPMSHPADLDQSA